MGAAGMSFVPVPSRRRFGSVSTNGRRSPRHSGASHRSRTSEIAGLIPGRIDRVAEYLNTRFISRRRIAMWQMLIARRGEIIWRGEQGLADVERSEAVARDTMFRI